MKSVNRIITLLVVILGSFTIIFSLFVLLTTDVQAQNRLAVNVSGPITTNTTWTAARTAPIF